MKRALVCLAIFLAGTAYGMYSMRAQNGLFRAYQMAARTSGLLWADTRGQFRDVGRRHEVACPVHPLVILAMGQSNAANHLGMRHRGAPGVVNFFGGRCYAAEDPLLGATGESGSLWTELGNKLAAARGGDVVIAPFAIQGTRVAQWNRDLAQALDAELQDLRGRYMPDLVLWQQGEADAHVTDPEAYAAELRALIRHVRGVFPSARWLVATATLCKAAPDRALAGAQRSVVDGQQVLAGPDTDAMNSFESRSDGCHFSDVGEDMATDRRAAAIAAAAH